MGGGPSIPAPPPPPDPAAVAQANAEAYKKNIETYLLRRLQRLACFGKQATPAICATATLARTAIIGS
jgi:hypothetical protein